MDKLGLIAGGGRLPIELAEFCERAERPVFVVRIKPFADPALARFDGVEAGIAEFGKTVAAMKAAGCAAVCFAGTVQRPDFKALKPDLKGLAILPGAVAAAGKGDDALLRYLLGQYEKEGFRPEGADEVKGELTLGAGALGSIKPDEDQWPDLEKALVVARASGRLDIGQGAVVCEGLVLAVEAQEGTDAMLARVATLPPDIRGREGVLRGVLAKAPKPIQDRKVDLPTIGVATVQGAARAGLAGIVGEAGGVIVLDGEAVAEAADALGLFVWGARADGAS